MQTRNIKTHGSFCGRYVKPIKSETIWNTLIKCDKRSFIKPLFKSHKTFNWAMNILKVRLVWKGTDGQKSSMSMCFKQLHTILFIYLQQQPNKLNMSALVTSMEEFGIKRSDNVWCAVTSAGHINALLLQPMLNTAGFFFIFNSVAHWLWTQLWWSQGSGSRPLLALVGRYCASQPMSLYSVRQLSCSAHLNPENEQQEQKHEGTTLLHGHWNFKALSHSTVDGIYL